MTENRNRNQCCGSESGIRCLFDPWIRDPGRGKTGSGSGMNNPDYISESLQTNFWVKMLKSFDADPRSGIRDGKNSDPGTGMEKTRIRDGKNSRSGINIPDPQH
jgi:hypothetical protein